MNRPIFLICFFLLISVSANAQIDSSQLVWPTPPDRARVRHLQTISSLENFDHSKGFFSGMFHFLFGGESSSQWLVQPLSVAVTPKGILYITDPGAKGVHIIDQEEKEYEFFGETSLGKFVSPVGCAISPDGAIFISDSELGYIVALNDEREVQFKISEHLKRPTGIAIHENRLYVTDTGLHKIVVFDLKGNFVTEFGKRGEGQGEFNFPVSVAAGDSIAVIDALNFRVQKFDYEGYPGSTFGRQGNVAGRFASPKAIAYDSDGNIYVTDVLMDCVQIFNGRGELLLIVGKNGIRDGEFISPNGIAIDKNNRIYVVESLNRRIQIFEYLK